MALFMASLFIGRRCLNRRIIYVEVPGLSLRLSLRLREREGMGRCIALSVFCECCFDKRHCVSR